MNVYLFLFEKITKGNHLKMDFTSSPYFSKFLRKFLFSRASNIVNNNKINVRNENKVLSNYLVTFSKLRLNHEQNIGKRNGELIS